MFPSIILDVYYMKNKKSGKRSEKYTGTKISPHSGLDPGNHAWQLIVLTTGPPSLFHRNESS